MKTGDIEKNAEITEIGEQLIQLALGLQEDIVFKDRPATNWKIATIGIVLVTIALAVLFFLDASNVTGTVFILFFGLLFALYPFRRAQDRLAKEFEDAAAVYLRMQDQVHPDSDLRQDRGVSAVATDSPVQLDSGAASPMDIRPENNKLTIHALGKAFARVGQRRGIAEWEGMGTDLIAKAKADPLADTVALVGEARGSRLPPIRIDGGSETLK